MENPENETRRDDAKTEQRNEEQTEELRDLEPQKDVKGGLWPYVNSSQAYNPTI